MIILACYLTGLVIWFICVAFAYKHDDEVKQVPQWLLVFSCLIWPITIFIILWDIVATKQKTSK